MILLSKLQHAYNLVCSVGEESEVDYQPKKRKRKTAPKKKIPTRQSDERQVRFNFRNCFRKKNLTTPMIIFYCLTSQ